MLWSCVIRVCGSGLIIKRLNDLLSTVLPPLPERARGGGHMTSKVHYTSLLFIYIDGPRNILGGSVVFSFDDLKFLVVLFLFGVCMNSFLPLLSISQTQIPGNLSRWKLHVGELCLCAMHWDEWLIRRKAQVVRGLAVLSGPTRNYQRPSEWNVTFCLDSV